MTFEAVIGLETHVELSTKTKIFCACSTEFGGEPNTRCCEVCVGMPGALPSLNGCVVEFAAKAGLVFGSTINETSIMSRKHYFYPDLTKAFQTSQFDKPLCSGGGVTLKNGRTIGVTRIHIEEDAGKLIHMARETRIDYNRAGVPLIEIVTEPDFRSADEVTEYLEYLQTALRAIGVSDCRMQEGSLRCDVNLSLRPAGQSALGVRSETKNLNSFASVAAAIEFETARQSEILLSGGDVIQETRSFDAETGETLSLRGKENADDYRYFDEPDIVPIVLSIADIEAYAASMPELPDNKRKRYASELGLAETDAKLLTKYSAVSEYFERVSEGVSPRYAAAFIITNVFSGVSTEAERERLSPPVPAAELNNLLRLTESGRISKNVAKRIYSEMAETGKRADELITTDDTSGFGNDEIAMLCESAIEQNPKSASDYTSGKEKALGALVGAVMRATRGAADAQRVEAELRRRLK